LLPHLRSPRYPLRCCLLCFSPEPVNTNCATDASNSYHPADPYLSREQRLHIRGGGLKEKLFPKITDFGIENDHFYRKRAGQRSGSKPKPGGTGAQERVVRSSHARVDVPANDEGTGRRIVRPVSRTYGKGEQVPGSLSTSPVAEYVTQSPLQQRSARELSEAVGSNVLSNQSYQSGPIDGTTTNNRSSRAGTLPPPVPPKVPLSASVCILCDSQQAVVKAAAGAFCDECWTAAHQAAGNAPSATHIDNAAPDVANCASMSDNGDSDSPLDQITAENTRRNRHVHFEVPQSSSITRDLNVDENIKNPPIRQTQMIVINLESYLRPLKSRGKPYKVLKQTFKL